MRLTLPFASLAILSLIGCTTGNTESPPSPVPAEQTDAQDDDPGEYGPGLNEVHVVRSLTVNISGGLTETISGKKADGHTTLSGICKPDMFANLSFDTGGTFDDRGGIGFATTDPIRAGQTGEINLEWVLVDTFKINNGNSEAKRFKSDGGTLTLTVHDPAKGNRRMVGTIVAKNLEPLDGLQSHPVDVAATFDADFSCGLK
jgi:hypothetical protein